MAEKEKKKVEKKVDAAKPEAVAKEAVSAEKEGKVEKAEGAEGAAATKRIKKKGRKNVPVGLVFIKSTFNNTTVTFADVNGNTVVWSSAGTVGFKGSRKSTPFAAQVAAEAAAQKALDSGMRSVAVYVKGPGAGRESAVRAIQKSGIRISGIRDLTPIPHNGCRPPKKRRV